MLDEFGSLAAATPSNMVKWIFFFFFTKTAMSGVTMTSHIRKVGMRWIGPCRWTRPGILDTDTRT